MYRTDITVGNRNTICHTTTSKMYAETNNTQFNDKRYRHGRDVTGRLPKRMNKFRNRHRKSISVEYIRGLVSIFLDNLYLYLAVFD